MQTPILNPETWLAQTKLRPPQPRPDIVARPRLLNAGYSTGRPFNPFQRLLFSAGTRDARTARLIGEFGGGLFGVSELLSPAALGRALWANLARPGSSEVDMTDRRTSAV